jgi:uncharacterized membrane protein YhhN
MNEKSRWAFILLAFLTVINLFAVFIGETLVRYLTKPLLMPVLMVAYLLGHNRKNVFSRILMVGLFFSWLGDIFLMIQNEGIYFILGLCCFLTTHIQYIVYFLKTKADGKSFLQDRPWLLAIIIVYGGGLLYIVWPGLGELKIPVIVYAVIICTMLSMAWWQYGRLPTQTAILFISGAALFVLSDSILAIGKFVHPFIGDGLVIMATYVAAQVMIVLGSLSHQQLLEQREKPSFSS